jgi:hypothetical protein
VRDARFKYIRNHQPGKPYAQHIEYMELMPTLKEWRRLHKEDIGDGPKPEAERKLRGPRALFFAPEKPKEELYDTQADRDEVRNLATDAKYAPVLARMRAENDRFVKAIGDLGFLPEPQLQERMRPGGKWMRTAAVSTSRAGGAITLACATPGSSIAYTWDAGSSARWKLYSQPLAVKAPGVLRAKACRLGYLDSEEREFRFD